MFKKNNNFVTKLKSLGNHGKYHYSHAWMTMDVHHGLAIDRLTSSSSLNSSVFSGECNSTPITRVVSIVVFLVLDGQSGGWSSR